MRIGVAAFYKAMNRKSTPRWRGPARIFDVDVTGATVKFQSETFEAPRFCAREREGEEDAEDVESDPMQARARPREVAPSENSMLRY